MGFLPVTDAERQLRACQMGGGRWVERGQTGRKRKRKREREKERKREREKEREIEGRKGNRIITQRSAEEIHKNGCQRNEATPDETTVKKINQSINQSINQNKLNEIKRIKCNGICKQNKKQRNKEINF